MLIILQIMFLWECFSILTGSMNFKNFRNSIFENRNIREYTVDQHLIEKRHDKPEIVESNPECMIKSQRKVEENVQEKF